MAYDEFYDLDHDGELNDVEENLMWEDLDRELNGAYYDEQDDDDSYDEGYADALDDNYDEARYDTDADYASGVDDTRDEEDDEDVDEDYEEGYNAVVEDNEYDGDRYDCDFDYARGVDDALNEGYFADRMEEENDNQTQKTNADVPTGEEQFGEFYKYIDTPFCQSRVKGSILRRIREILSLSETTEDDGVEKDDEYCRTIGRYIFIAELKKMEFHTAKQLAEELQISEEEAIELLKRYAPEEYEESLKASTDEENVDSAKGKESDYSERTSELINKTIAEAREHQEKELKESYGEFYRFVSTPFVKYRVESSKKRIEQEKLLKAITSGDETKKDSKYYKVTGRQCFIEVLQKKNYHTVKQLAKELQIDEEEAIVLLSRYAPEVCKEFKEASENESNAKSNKSEHSTHGDGRKWVDVTNEESLNPSEDNKTEQADEEQYNQGNQTYVSVLSQPKYSGNYTQNKTNSSSVLPSWVVSQKIPLIIIGVIMAIAIITAVGVNAYQDVKYKEERREILDSMNHPKNTTKGGENSGTSGSSSSRSSSSGSSSSKSSSSQSSASKSNSSSSSSSSSKSNSSLGKSSSSSSKSNSSSGKSSSSSSKSKSKSGNSLKNYDDGYNAVYDDDDYSWSRYNRDSDYASGVDDAMEDMGW